MSCALASKSGSWLLSQYTLRCGLRSASSRMRQLLERLMGCSRCCGSAATKSSRLHRVAGQCYVAGFLVAMDSTATRSEGGNAPRASRAWGILQAIAPVRQITLTPAAHRMALTGPCGGHLQMRWVVWRRAPEDQSTAQGEGLGGGMRAHQRL